METDRMARQKDFLAQGFAGLFSGFLYLSYALSFVFLVPVQHAFRKRGTKRGLAVAAMAMATIAMGQAGRLNELKSLDFRSLAVGLAPPLLFLASIIFANAKTGKLSSPMKILISALAISLLAAPMVVESTENTGLVANLKAYVVAAYEASGADANPAELHGAVDAAIQVLRSAFSVFILWMIAGNWWLGAWTAAKSREKETGAEDPRTEGLRMSNFHIPSFLLWPTLGTWAGLFVILATGTKGIPALVGWNLALWTASFYAVQGIGILWHFSERYKAGRLARLFLPLLVLLLFVAPAAAAVALSILPILGITEVWLPYRTLKGALK
ncbi:MAG: hypothetical protein AB1407_12320 [Spirochaetota bacterium]